jgi:hypothetical protein
MRGSIAGFTLALSLYPLSGQSTEAEQQVVFRLGIEADRFAQKAARVVGRETLQQTILDVKKWNRGQRGKEEWPPLIKREIVSDYSYYSQQAGSGALREIRQVISVDRKPIKSLESGLEALAAGVTSSGDAQRRKLLEGFEKHGLHGVATDFGQVILLFANGNIQKYELAFLRHEQISGEWLSVYRFQQLDGDEALTIFESGAPMRQKMRGEIWVRRSDALPRQIVLLSERGDKMTRVRDVATVDYTSSDFGVVLPSAVLHQQFRNGVLVVEDRFSYSDFREFAPSNPK